MKNILYTYFILPLGIGLLSFLLVMAWFFSPNPFGNTFIVQPKSPVNTLEEGK